MTQRLKDLARQASTAQEKSDLSFGRPPSCGPCFLTLSLTLSPLDDSSKPTMGRGGGSEGKSLDTEAGGKSERGNAMGKGIHSSYKLLTKCGTRRAPRQRHISVLILSILSSFFFGPWDTRPRGPAACPPFSWFLLGLFFSAPPLPSRSLAPPPGRSRVERTSQMAMALAESPSD